MNALQITILEKIGASWILDVDWISQKLISLQKAIPLIENGLNLNS